MKKAPNLKQSESLVPNLWVKDMWFLVHSSLFLCCDALSMKPFRMQDGGKAGYEDVKIHYNTLRTAEVEGSLWIIEPNPCQEDTMGN